MSLNNIEVTIDYQFDYERKARAFQDNQIKVH